MSLPISQNSANEADRSTLAFAATIYIRECNSHGKNYVRVIPDTPIQKYLDRLEADFSHYQIFASKVKRGNSGYFLVK